MEGERQTGSFGYFPSMLRSDPPHRTSDSTKLAVSESVVYVAVCHSWLWHYNHFLDLVSMLQMSLYTCTSIIKVQRIAESATEFDTVINVNVLFTVFCSTKFVNVWCFARMYLLL